MQACPERWPAVDGEDGAASASKAMHWPPMRRRDVGLRGAGTENTHTLRHPAVGPTKQGGRTREENRGGGGGRGPVLPSGGVLLRAAGRARRARASASENGAPATLCLALTMRAVNKQAPWKRAPWRSAARGGKRAQRRGGVVVALLDAHARDVTQMGRP